MEKKKIIIICLVIVFFIIAIVLLKTKTSSNKPTEQVKASEVKSEIQYSDEHSVYYVTKENSNTILYVTSDKNDPDLQFYAEHPDYNPNPLAPSYSDISDYILSQESSLNSTESSLGY